MSHKIGQLWSDPMGRYGSRRVSRAGGDRSFTEHGRAARTRTAGVQSIADAHGSAGLLAEGRLDGSDRAFTLRQRPAPHAAKGPLAVTVAMRVVGRQRQFGPVRTSRSRSAKLPRAEPTAAVPRTADIRGPAVALPNDCLTADSGNKVSALDRQHPLLNSRSPSACPASKPLSLSRRFPETPPGLPLTMGRASPHPARPR